MYFEKLKTVIAIVKHHPINWVVFYFLGVNI
nr:MAG TPA: hypothetical protein [Caudoviricetes sp.]